MSFEFCIYTYPYIYIYTHIHIHIYICVCIYIYICLCIYIFMYVCTRFYPTGVLRAPEAYSSGCAGLKLLLWRWPKSRCRGSRVSGDTYLYLYYIHICFHFCKYVYICVDVYIYIYIHIYIDRYIYIYADLCLCNSGPWTTFLRLNLFLLKTSSSSWVEMVDKWLANVDRMGIYLCIKIGQGGAPVS